MAKRKQKPPPVSAMPDVCRACKRRKVCSSSDNYMCDGWKAVFAENWNRTVVFFNEFTQKGDT